MPTTNLFEELSLKESDKEAIAAKMIKNPEMLSDVFEGLNSDKARIKFGSDKILRIVARKKPILLYSKIDFFINNIENENTFLKLGALDIISSLTEVDTDNKFESIIDKYYKPITGPELMTATNIIKSSSTIALSKPNLIPQIIKKLLKVEKATYKSKECLDIALGHTIESFDKFFDKIQDKKEVIKFVNKQCKSQRAATKKKADKFIKKHL